jgi:hypothetical protein
MTRKDSAMLQIVFSNVPNSAKKFLDGIESPQTVDELASLYRISSSQLIAGSFVLTLPDKVKLATLSIKSIELSNLLSNYSGDDIYVYPNIQTNSLFTLAPPPIVIP